MEHHRPFDKGLGDLKKKLMHMAALAEGMIDGAVGELVMNDARLAERVPQQEHDLNRLQIEVDEAVMSAYGWNAIPLDHGFHTYRQLERWTVSPTARIEILDRLLQLNHERARAEGQNVPEQLGTF